MSMDAVRLVTSLPGPKAQALIARDRAVLSPSYTRGYPLVVQRGQGAIIEDVDGNRFLDCNAGIAVVATGHCHPRVVDAIQRQAAQLIHMSGTDFYYENMIQLAETLARLAPGGGPRRVYFGNSGTEAIEAALKLARHHTGRQQFISFFGGFHGRTMGALSLTASKSIQKKGGRGAPLQSAPWMREPAMQSSRGANGDWPRPVLNETPHQPKSKPCGQARWYPEVSGAHPRTLLVKR